MASALQELIESLHGSDTEGSGVAYALRIKSVSFGATHDLTTGHDWGPSGAPLWHPSNPSHPHHDIYNEFNGDMPGVHYWQHPALGDAHEFMGKPLVPAHRHPEAESRAAAVRADPRVVHPNNRRFVDQPARSSPIHPNHEMHDFYLANPAWMHGVLGHDSPDPEYSWDRTSYRKLSLMESHPLHPNHPDHEHFLAAHANNRPYRPTMPYWTSGGVNVFEPYQSVVGGITQRAGSNNPKPPAT